MQYPTSLTESNLMQQMLPFFLEQGDGMVVCTNPQGVVVYVNKAFVASTGYAREDVVGRHLSTFTAGQHPLAIQPETLDALALGQSWRGDVRAVRKNGDGYWQSCRFLPMANESGTSTGILALLEDITERKQVEDAFKERLAFEELLSDLSARFVNLPSDQVDAEIELALQRLIEFFPVDRCGLLQALPDKLVWKVSHLACVTGVKAVPVDTELSGSIYPWVYETVTLHRQVVALSTLDDLPQQATIDKQTYREWGIRSSLVIPIAVDKTVIYVIAIDAVKSERCWQRELIPRLRLLGEVFVNALVRKKADQDLQASEERLTLASTAAEVGLWMLNMETGQVWATQTCLDLFHLSGEQLRTVEDFLGVVHSEDRGRVRQLIATAPQLSNLESIEYRILLPDGSLRWIISRGQYSSNKLDRPASLMGVSIDITKQKELTLRLEQQLAEINSLKRQLETENRYLIDSVKTEQGFGTIVGSSDVLQYVLFRAKQVAPTDATVLILGETGTGKGLVANAIHEMSGRSKRPMITVNCAALPANLIESELFGREKGAFTGAHVQQAGRFELADGGTLFLDEIGEMPLELQVKLLRVLQDGQFERLGGSKTIKVDVRLIAATSRDLKADIASGRFREDLYYRLHVFPISLPPLRLRTDDIPQLVHFFLDKFGRRFNKHFASVTEETMQALARYHWPGNVRELEHIIERWAILCQGPEFHLVDPSLELPMVSVQSAILVELDMVTRAHVLQVLQNTNWRIEGKGGAAETLGLHPSTLRFRIKKLGIQRP